MAGKVKFFDRVTNFFGLSEGFVDEDEEAVVERNIQEEPSFRTSTPKEENRTKPVFNRSSSPVFEEEDFEVESDISGNLFGAEKRKNDQIRTVAEEKEEVQDLRQERKSVAASLKDLRRNPDTEKRGETKDMVNVSESQKINIFFAKPTEYSDEVCKEICSNIRAQKMVTINFEDVRQSDDKIRIYDFVSGCCAALDCKFEQVSSQVFIAAPVNTKVFKMSDREESKDRNEVYNFNR